MRIESHNEYFFQRRWPNGFECPRCAHNEYYVIETRSLPLYQCCLCTRQTSVTAGTVMNKSRTPLVKWAAAIELLASTNGVNAKELAAAIGVTHKVAWTMLRKFRQAIAEAESDRKLEGAVYGGLRAFAPSSIWIFLPHRRYRRERVVSLCASVSPAGTPTALKFDMVPPGALIPGMKELTKEEEDRILAKVARARADASWLNDSKFHRSPLRACFDEANRWLLRRFNGVGSKYLQSYLDEFGFRWNAAAQGKSLQDEWFDLCFRFAG